MVLYYLISFIRVIMTLTRPLSYVLFDFIGRIILGKKEILPPIQNKILLMSATELAAQIRRRELTAEEVMKAYIDRVKQVDPFINACVDERYSTALIQARSVDRQIEGTKLNEQQLASNFPLFGVPFSCKEMIGVEGMTQTNGLLFYKDRKAPSNAEVVSKYVKAGAIPFIVTNVPTVSMGWDTSNLIFGRTSNPYDKRRTVGGSSGGEAAILATAGSVIGIGNDIGGSIRIPSAFCGVYGHKPSRGIISNQREWPGIIESYDPFRSTGPMCRYVEDLKMLVGISSGEDAGKLKLNEEVDFTKVKICYMEEIPSFLLSATTDIKKAIKKAVTHFEDKFGISPVKLSMEEMKYSFDIWQSKFIQAHGPPIKCLQESMNVSWYRELVKCIFRRAQFDFPLIMYALAEKSHKDSEYYKCLGVYEDMRIKFEDILSGDSILLLPTHPEPAPHLYTTIPKTKNIGYTCIFNILGYPATNIPAGMSHGVPIGLQAVAAQDNDRLTLAAAEELDKVFNGWNSPCEVNV